jgi:hypothetical protein
MERCPQCRARLKGTTVCGRCEADLSSLLAIEATADILARRAVQALLAGDVPDAAQQAVMARDLQATPFHRALVGFVEKFARPMSLYPTDSCGNE